MFAPPVLSRCPRNPDSWPLMATDNHGLSNPKSAGKSATLGDGGVVCHSCPFLPPNCRSTAALPSRSLSLLINTTITLTNRLIRWRLSGRTVLFQPSPFGSLLCASSIGRVRFHSFAAGQGFSSRVHHVEDGFGTSLESYSVVQDPASNCQLLSVSSEE